MGNLENDRQRPPTTFKMVDKNELFNIKTSTFESNRKIHPVFREVQLAGLRVSPDSERMYTAIGVTMKNGIIVSEDVEQMETENPNLYSLRMDLYPGAKEVQGYEWICTAFIDGTTLVYQSIFTSYNMRVGREDSVSETSGIWSSINKNDTAFYEIMVSPQNTEFLS